MKLNAQLITLAYAALLLFAGMAQATIQTVPSVDVGRYLGTWYQIARNPLIFEGNCACSRQVLTAQSDGNVGVYNSCNDTTPSGALREIRGVAISQDPATNARFTVDFNLPRTGQYWIIGLDTDYRYAVVSDPSEKSLYILSKTPELDVDLYNQAVAEAAKQLDISKLEKTIQLGCTYP